MNVRAITAGLATLETPLLAVPVFEDDDALPGLLSALDGSLGGATARARAAGDLAGKAGTSTLFYAGGEAEGPVRVLALGVGKREKQDGESVRRLAGRAIRAAEKLSVKEVTLRLEAAGSLQDAVGLARAGAEGAVLAGWEFRELRSENGEDDEEEAHACVESLGIAVDGAEADVAEGIRVGVAQAEGENFARTLQSRPGNIATPSHLANEASALARELGLDVTTLGPDELRSENMHALLAVSRGSAEEPRLIVLRHSGGDAGDAPLVLVGKGLTFDAGGISIKPAAGMEDMKYDMSGGAAVLGAMRAIAQLEVPLNVVGIVPSSENLPSGSALKPGDVIGTREGKTVEVINTDAEGRLILADALSYARTLEPAAIVDCATLTGACVIALGNHASAVLGNEETLIAEVREAGERSGERCWPLPLWDEYDKQLESTVADLKNVGGRPAGTVTAACFLSHFVGDVPWAHLDIAGTAYGEGKLPYQRKGALGVPTRLLVEWVRGRVG